MSNVLGEYPLDFSRPELRAIQEVLARAFYQPRQLEDVILAASLNPGMIDYGGTPLTQWRSILTRARAEDRVSNLLDAVTRFDPPAGQRVGELLGPQPILEPGTGRPDDLSAPDGPGWRGFGAERQIVAESDTLVGIAFLSTGVLRSRSICRITATFGPDRAMYGTAALIGPDLLLTNHHVLHDWDRGGQSATAVEAWFDYELGEAGNPRIRTVVPCDAVTITGDRINDWSIARTAQAPPPDAEVLPLGGAPVPRKDDYVFIIQHPEGLPKMIGLSHNLVRYVDENVLQYWTDTKTGSSGAPVFNTDWQVVGLHHRWVPAPKGDGVAYRNQGRRIERVIEGLQQHGVTV
jgi:Trypsin-like peptidase domain/Effector-associated domain 1